MSIPRKFASLYHGQEIFVWSDCLLDLGTDLLVGPKLSSMNQRPDRENALKLCVKEKTSGLHDLLLHLDCVVVAIYLLMKVSFSPDIVHRG